MKLTRHEPNIAKNNIYFIGRLTIFSSLPLSTQGFQYNSALLKKVLYIPPPGSAHTPPTSSLRSYSVPQPQYHHSLRLSQVRVHKFASSFTTLQTSHCSLFRQLKFTCSSSFELAFHELLTPFERSQASVNLV